jgi:hypothetical protein
MYLHVFVTKIIIKPVIKFTITDHRNETFQYPTKYQKQNVNISFYKISSDGIMCTNR